MAMAMSAWITVAAVGMLVSIAALLIAVGRYREGRLAGRNLVAIICGFFSFAAYAALSQLAPAVATGPVVLVLLLPALVAILILARDHEAGATPPRDT